MGSVVRRKKILPAAQFTVGGWQWAVGSRECWREEEGLELPTCSFESSEIRHTPVRYMAEDKRR